MAKNLTPSERRTMVNQSFEFILKLTSLLYFVVIKSIYIKILKQSCGLPIRISITQNKFSVSNELLKTSTISMISIKRNSIV